VGGGFISLSYRTERKQNRGGGENPLEENPKIVSEEMSGELRERKRSRGRNGRVLWGGGGRSSAEKKKTA